MAGKRIIWSFRAKRELTEVLEFYVHRNGNPKYSLKILNQLENLLATLSVSDQIGRLTSNDITRVIPMKAYLIFYEIGKNQIEVVSFWDNRQNPDKKITE